MGHQLGSCNLRTGNTVSASNAHRAMHSRVTSNLHLHRQFPDNPSFDCCWVIPSRAQEEWPMDREPIAHSCSKLLLGYELPLPGTCRMKYQESFTCSSGTLEALALVT